MKKNLKIICVIILLSALILPITYSHAIANTNINQSVKEKQFFEISKLEIAKKDKIEMTLNLDSIKFNDFVFELKSDEVLKNIEISQKDKIETEKNYHEIIMEISKEKTNIKTINFYYWVPDSKKVGDTIRFIATVTSIVKNETAGKDINKNKVSVEEDELVDNTQKDKIENIEQKIETKSIEFEVKIIEDKKEDNQQENKKPNTDNIKEENQTPNTDNNNENNKQPINNNEQSTNKGNISSLANKGTTQNIQYSGIASQSFGSNQAVKTVTYNGSDNNYLNKLLVNDYTLNTEFSKENTTYFMTVENEIEKLDITASVEDSGASICIYGNENINTGTNKVLIAVTAENGNVRNYRIYVTKKA